MEILFLALAATVGLLLGWLMALARAAQRTQHQMAAAMAEAEKSKMLTAQWQQAKAELEHTREQLQKVTNDLITTEANYVNLEEKLQERKTELTELQEKFTAQFKNLANDIFEEKSKRFTEQNKSNIFDLLKPLGEKITAFEKKVEDTHKDSIGRNAALREQLENLQKLNLQMTREAENLTRALKGDSQAQGAWGEFILESILEKSGLERDREYSVQESFATAEGRLRPDVIIRLPENKHVVIDSKVSLKAYNAFVNAENEADKAAALKMHLASIRQHMKGLADKNYQKNISDTGLSFVIMFIPIEPAYILAIQSEQGLYEEAWERGIMFVSPTLLIPTLQLIKNIWKQEYQNRNVIEIASKAGDLYDKFVGFIDDLTKVGYQMDATKKVYEESMKKLYTGSGNLVRRTEDLKKLGAKAQKSIDPKLLGRSEEQTDLFGG
jgi:DNA recombination protein RmuC